MRALVMTYLLCYGALEIVCVLLLLLFLWVCLCSFLCAAIVGHQHEFTLDMARNLIALFTVSFSACYYYYYYLIHIHIHIWSPCVIYNYCIYYCYCCCFWPIPLELGCIHNGTCTGYELFIRVKLIRVHGHSYKQTLVNSGAVKNLVIMWNALNLLQKFTPLSPAMLYVAVDVKIASYLY